MIKLTEHKKGNTVLYNYQIYSGKTKKYEEEIEFLTTSVKRGDFTYLILYDENYAPISLAFEFLNNIRINQSINTRNNNLEALKFLYCFQKIISKNIEEFGVQEYTMLKNFLLGKSFQGDIFEMNLITERTEGTFNGYMATYRQYAKFLSIDAQLIKEIKSYYLPDTHTKVQKFESNAKSSKSILQEDIEYISLEEFVKIISIVRAKYTIREEIMIRLMYEAGMRIGEVLGLTADDIRMEKYNGSYTGTIYIRNRLSDKKDQHAKSCMKVLYKRDYKSKKYRTKDYGYQNVYISKELYDLVDKYIEEYHVPARDKKSNRYFKSTIADRVDDDIESDDMNYYVFINSQGSRLAGSTWNEIIKDIFLEIGLVLDKEKREANLNHRLRHGFAMFNVQFLHADAEELRIKLRHRLIESVKVYLRYTKEDKVKIKDTFTDSLYNLVPELRKLNNER